MTSALQAQVTARFGAGGAGSIPLSIEGDPGLFIDSDIHLLLIPDVEATLATDVGTVVKGGKRVLDVPAGVIQLSGSDTAQLPALPVDSRPEFHTLFAFDSKGQPTTVNVFWDADSNTVRAFRPCHAVVSYTAYKTTARMLTYTPQVSTLSVGSLTTYGVIAAFYPPSSMAIYQVQPTSFADGEDMIELYAILSYSVTTRDGEFELPPGFPATFTYPGKTLELDSSLVAKNERIHEVGYMNARGYAWVETKNVPVREPYIGDVYTPTKSKRVATLDPAKYPPDIIAKAADFIKSRGLGKV